MATFELHVISKTKYKDNKIQKDPLNIIDSKGNFPYILKYLESKFNLNRISSDVNHSSHARVSLVLECRPQTLKKVSRKKLDAICLGHLSLTFTSGDDDLFRRSYCNNMSCNLRL